VPEGQVIADTGLLVAFLAEAEARHDWAVDQFREFPVPLLTCESVLTETWFLISRQSDGIERFFDLLRTGLLDAPFDLVGERDAVGALARKYADLPMSLADACLVRMAELHEGAAVCTLDHHFRIYRKNGRQKIPLIMPPGR
jgi:predicted nucleic acid-binding protein